jgi:hypothetical protein
MKSTARSFSRREFAKRSALGAAAMVTPVSFAPVHADPAQQSQGAAKLSPQSAAEAESRYQTILQQYPDRFSEAQKADLKRLCVAVQRPLGALRSYPLSNGDQPALYLKPIVEREKKTNAPPNLKSPPPSGGKSAPSPNPASPKSADSAGKKP